MGKGNRIASGAGIDIQSITKVFTGVCTAVHRTYDDLIAAGAGIDCKRAFFP